MTGMSKVLVTGANGFIGTHFCNALAREGITYACLERSLSAWPSALGDNLDVSSYSAIVHLAMPRIRESNSWEEIERDTIVPLNGLIVAIRKTNPACVLIYISSQSASPVTSSKYGRIKWRCEQLLASADIPAVIVRPGLVLGPGSRGLFPAILRFLKHSRVVPLVGEGREPIQVLSVSALSAALIHLCKTAPQHKGRVYNLALTPLPFREFLAFVGKRLGKNLLFVPIPKKAAYGALAVLEYTFINPPFTRVNLDGLLNLQVMETQPSMQNLLPGYSTALSDIIDEALLEPKVSKCGEYADDEARFLAGELFGLKVGEGISEKYRRAIALLPPAKGPDLRKIMRYRLDVEAIEFALRRKAPDLTRRIHVLLYLLEFEPSFFGRLTNTRGARVQAWILLTASVVRAAYKKLKGLYLVWRYCLV